MNEGEIIQVGYPSQIYKDPNSSFVADFLGKANFIKGKALSKNEFKISDNITIKTNFKNFFLMLIQILVIVVKKKERLLGVTKIIFG